MNELINKITTGDARELSKLIPDESIDLIFTDPVYDRIEDYEWLAKEAQRILKPDSACLAWTGTHVLAETILAMKKNLTYRWILHIFKRAFGGSYLFKGYKIINKQTPCLWFDKGRKLPNTFIWDVEPTGHERNKAHKWMKGRKETTSWINSFSNSGDIVFDPFSGSGTIPAVCKMLGRNYIAFEIDSETAELARERVLNTQPPLFVLEPEQLELSDEKAK